MKKATGAGHFSGRLDGQIQASVSRRKQHWAPVLGAVLLLAAVSSPAQTNFLQLYSFGPGVAGGSSPRGTLLEASDGWIYGTTSGGGTNGQGVVFKVSKAGTGFTVLHTFTDGYSPWGGVVEAGDGSLCGTTFSGSTSYGTVYKLNKDGTGYVLLHTFTGISGDGAQPATKLTVGPGGLLFGTTLSGGVANAGTLFALRPDGSGYIVLHEFTGAAGGADGSGPNGGLLQGPNGVLYGTTQAGGSNDLGTVFKLNADGAGYTVLHHFAGASLDGRQAFGPVTLGSDGKLYGTTYYGGASDKGTVFSLSTNGTGYAVLLSFVGSSLGNQPYAGVVQGTDGKLYGTTRYGGSRDGGTVFQLNTDGSGYTVLHDLTGLNGEGSQPMAPLLRGSDGALYGSTYYGGAYLTNGVSGTLFRLYAPLPPSIVGESLSGGEFQVNFTGPAGQPYTLLASTNLALPLTSWTVLTNGVLSGPTSFTDSNVGAARARFYRVRSP